MPLCNHHLRDTYKLYLNHQGSKANTLRLASNKYMSPLTTEEMAPQKQGTLTMRILKYQKNSIEL